MNQHEGIILHNDMVREAVEDVISSAVGVDLNMGVAISGIATAGTGAMEKVNVDDGVDGQVKIVLCKHLTATGDFIRVNLDLIDSQTYFDMYRKGDGAILYWHYGHWCIAGRFYGHRNNDYESKSDDAIGVAATVWKTLTLITNTVAVGIITLPDGLYTGQIKQFVVAAYSGASATTQIQPTNFRPGTFILFDETVDPVGCGCTMVWDGTKWSVIGTCGGEIT